MISSLNRMRLRLRALLKRSHQNEVHEEFKLHLELLEEELRSGGMPAEEARLAARRRFGNVTSLQEQSHDVFAFGWLDDLGRDLRFTVRSLSKSPGFTVVALAILALGIGACVAAFSAVKAIVLDPMPFPSSEQLVTIDIMEKGGGQLFTPMPAFEEYARRARSLSQLAAWWPESAARDDDGPVEVLEYEAVRGNYLGLLGVQPLLGTLSLAEESLPDGSAPAVLSYACWQRSWNGATDVLGKNFRLEGDRLFTIVGVLPETFQFSLSLTPSLWIPISEEFEETVTYEFEVFGRLRPGVSVAAAQAEMDVLVAGLAQQFPDVYRGNVVRITPLYDRVVFPDARRKVAVFVLAIGAVFLIGLLNLINLQASRLSQRQRELSVRAAIGASRWRLIRQMIAEGLALTFTGAMLGLLSVYAIRDALVSRLPSLLLPRTENIAIDGTAVIFTAGMAVLTGLLIGIVPAIRASRANVSSALGNGAPSLVLRRSDAWFRNFLTFTQTSLAVILLVAAGILIDDFVRFTAVDYGFDLQNLYGARVYLPKAYTDSARQNAFFARLRQQAADLPGVDGAAIATTLPMMGFLRTTVPGSSGGRPVFSSVREVSAEYASVLHMPILFGRWFSEDDIVQQTPVAVVSASLAQRMWPGQNALGRRVTTYGYQVIGVAADVKEHPRSGPEPGLYIPYTRSYRGGGAPLKTLAVKMNPTSLPALSRLIHDLEPLAMVDIKSTDDALASLVHRNRFQALLSSAFAGVACILAIVGVYSVLAFWTSQRTREIGLRIALGAQPRDVIVQVMQQGAAPAMLGLVVGLVSSLLLTRVLQAYLSKIQAAESASYAFVLVAMSVLVLLATWIPARRASRVDPMSALRHE